MFCLLDVDGRRNVLGVLRNEFERSRKSRSPMLRVVERASDSPLDPSAPAQTTPAAVHANKVRGATPEEAALLATYRALNDDGRERIVSLAWRFQKHLLGQLPVLALVTDDQHSCRGLQ